MQATRAGVTGCPSFAMAASTSVRSATFESMTTLATRLAYFSYYIENWSIWLDVVILIRTVLFGMFGENAF